MSIILCTRNRAHSLLHTLTAIGHVDVPTDMPTELVIVDNGSNDNTAQITREARPSNMHVKYLRVDEPGKSRALNKAVSASEGNIILLTDDDLIPPTDWIEKMCRPIAEGKCKAVQGRVTIPPHLRPEWLQGFLLAFVAAVDGKPGDTPPQLVGANAAISRAVFEVAPEFDVNLGPGSKNALGEDTLFGMQLMAAGIDLHLSDGDPAAHHFDPGRLQSKAFLAAVANSARAAAYIAHNWEHKEIAHPSLRALYYASKRAIRAKLLPTRRRNGVSPWEVTYVHRAAFFQEYARIRNSPPKYTKHCQSTVTR